MKKYNLGHLNTEELESLKSFLENLNKKMSLKENYDVLKDHVILFCDALDTFRFYDYADENYKLTTKLSIEDTLFYTNEFFKSLNDDEIYQTFLEVFENIDIEFTNDFDNTAYTTCDNNDIIISIPKTDDLRMLLDTIHEFAHAIAIKLKNSSDTNDFMEIEGYFIEMLALDYINENYPYETQKLLNSMYNDYLDSGSIICVKMLSSFLKYDRPFIYSNGMKNLTNTRIEDIINTKGSTVKEIIAQQISSPLRQFIGINISYKIYEKYLENKENGLNIYKSLVKDNDLSYDKIKNFIDIENDKGLFIKTRRLQ